MQQRHRERHAAIIVRPARRRTSTTAERWWSLSVGVSPKVTNHLLSSSISREMNCSALPGAWRWHASTVRRLNHLLSETVGKRALVSVQAPLWLSRLSEPQPDLALVKPRADFYANAHPTAADTWLVIEVADSSLRYDREIKLPLYARHGVPEVWIVDLDAKRLLIHGRPAGDRYAEITEHKSPGLTAITALPGVAVDLASLFG